jgi:serine/threonine-protein kinase RsbW
MLEFRAQYRGTPRSVREARTAVADYARRCGFPEQLTVEIALAAGEALANAVEHGNKDVGTIELRCLFEGGALVVEVTDQGEGFDFSAAGTRYREPNSIRGFGITIMRSLMDAIEYAERGTLVRLRKALHRDAAEAAGDERVRE